MPVYDDTERISELNTCLAYYENDLAKFDKLNGDNVINEYYSNYVDAIKKGVIVTADFKLSKTDFFQFNFSRMIYVKQLKSTFYVIEISNYTEDKNTTLKLLKS